MPWVLSLILHWAAAAASPAPHPDSRFGFSGTIEGEPFDAVFDRYQVNPTLDQAARPRGFVVDVDMAAIDGGNADLNAEMATAPWFDPAAFPLARFEGREVERLADGRYLLHGDLQLKGVRRALAIPFDWAAVGQGARMRGAVLLDRRHFGVGPDDVSSVAAEVRVWFDLRWSSL